MNYLGLSSIEIEFMNLSGEDYLCNKCRNIDSYNLIVETARKKLDEIHLKLNESEVKHEQIKLEATNLETIYSNKIGPLMKKVEKEKQGLNIRHEAYYGNIYTGSNAMKYLKHHDTITKTLPENLKTKWDEIFASLRFISERLLSTRRLDKDEIDLVNTEIKEFSKLWVNVSSRVCPKLDTLTMVVPRSLRVLDGLAGAISEQSIERLHSLVNQKAQCSRGIINSADRTKYLLEVKLLVYNIDLLFMIVTFLQFTLSTF